MVEKQIIVLDGSKRGTPDLLIEDGSAEVIRGSMCVI